MAWRIVNMALIAVAVVGVGVAMAVKIVSQAAKAHEPAPVSSVVLPAVLVIAGFVGTVAATRKRRLLEKQP